MKITGVKTYVLEATLGEHGFGWSQRVTDRRQSALCVVDTDEGIQGVGEAFYVGGPAQVVATLIDRGSGSVSIWPLCRRSPCDVSHCQKNLSATPSRERRTTMAGRLCTRTTVPRSSIKLSFTTWRSRIGSGPVATNTPVELRSRTLPLNRGVPCRET